MSKETQYLTVLLDILTLVSIGKLIIQLNLNNEEANQKQYVNSKTLRLLWHLAVILYFSFFIPGIYKYEGLNWAGVPSSNLLDWILYHCIKSCVAH